VSHEAAEVAWRCPPALLGVVLFALSAPPSALNSIACLVVPLNTSKEE